MSGLHKPEISIITALYNSEIFIQRTLTSVLKQTCTDWEHIVIDDCSTDNGPDIVRKAAEKDVRIKLIHLKINAGAGVARNRGIDEARGRFIAFIDSDDTWLPEKLEKQIRFMRQRDSPFSFTDYSKVDEQGRDLGTVVHCKRRLSYKIQLKTNFVGCSTAIYDTDFYGKKYFPEIRKRQDYGLWLRLLENGEEGHGLTDALTSYTVRSGGLSGKKIELIRHNWILYREVVGLGHITSAYYLMWNILIKILGRR